MKLIIDRIENKIAVCQNLETKEMIEILVEKLPLNCKEGSCINFENGIYTIDTDTENEIKKRIEEKMKMLWEN